MAKRSNLIARLICCHGGPHTRRDQVLLCRGCGSHWHRSCYEKVGGCCVNHGAHPRFKTDTALMDHNAESSLCLRENEEHNRIRKRAGRTATAPLV